MTIKINGKIFASQKSIWYTESAPAPAPVPTPPSGDIWVTPTFPAASASLNDVIWDGTKFMATGISNYDGGGVVVMTSTDGLDWSYNTSLRSTGWGSGNTSLYPGSQIIYNGSVHLLLGRYGRSAVSYDGGTTWEYNSNIGAISPGWTSSSLHVKGIWDGSRFVVSSGGALNLIVSTDGVNWSNMPGQTNGRGYRNLYWNGSVYIGTYNNQISSSPTGATWTTRYSFPSGTLGVASEWNGSYFLVAADAGRLAKSTDGITWTTITGLSSVTSSIYASATSAVSGLLWDGEKFATAGIDSQLALSTDSEATTWETKSSLFDSWGGAYIATSIAYNGLDRYVAVGGTSSSIPGMVAVD